MIIFYVIVVILNLSFFSISDHNHQLSESLFLFLLCHTQYFLSLLEEFMILRLSVLNRHYQLCLHCNFCIYHYTVAHYYLRINNPVDLLIRTINVHRTRHGERHTLEIMFIKSIFEIKKYPSEHLFKMVIATLFYFIQAHFLTTFGNYWKIKAGHNPYAHVHYCIFLSYIVLPTSNYCNVNIFEYMSSEHSHYGIPQNLATVFCVYRIVTSRLANPCIVNKNINIPFSQLITFNRRVLVLLHYIHTYLFVKISGVYIYVLDVTLGLFSVIPTVNNVHFYQHHKYNYIKNIVLKVINSRSKYYKDG